tara:strand:- start:2677 stop:2838 length:162 start_codon:yes stop_codon:yes gene_type:complete
MSTIKFADELFTVKIGTATIIIMLMFVFLLIASTNHANKGQWMVRRLRDDLGA